MVNRIGFREFLKKLQKEQEVQLILDANVIIAYRDKNHKDHDTIREFFGGLNKITKNVSLFTSVTTKAEFLEYYRRKTITEAILQLYKINKTQKIISDTVKQEIENQIRNRNLRQKREVEKQVQFEKVLESQSVDTTEMDIEGFSIDANYFKDSEIKSIKKSFRARNVQEEKGWLAFCSVMLMERMHSYEKLLDELCHYLTSRDDVSQKYFIKKDVEWRMATQICGETGMGYSDAMILNMANHTTIETILTLDFDLVYGGHFSAMTKVLLTPTDRLKNYKIILRD
ncbi:MAG: hypothetical protein HOP07_13550 [Bacteriovoracaceae bacterium]|nr:hypothetical protein [Bacteriovoracaceae bacterium]